ncbi:uncharacterized protein LOC109821527 [Asparagus officinalis]|uniref:uncharacterized protein LOC109821527 n=1 Tax=Asparagus officinalis TaxID=4686 RepID=UPI00098E57E8|nr:uncharacterized protein LOC109821527 [Asparagus officinalis]
MAPYEALYGRPCKSPICWAELEDSLLLGSELVRQTTEKVSPIKGVQQFGGRGKLALRYIGSFRIVDHHLHDEEHQRVIDAPELEIQVDLTTIEIPVCNLAREDKRLRNKVIPLMKVQWNQKGPEEAS